MKQLFIILSVAIVSVSAFGQDKKKTTNTRKEEKRQRINAMLKQEEEGIIAYKKSFAFGIRLNTDGYGIFFEKGMARSVKKATLFQLEINEKKHQKEIKQSGLYSGSSPFIYGKINFLYPIKLGVQQQFVLGNKSNKNGVSVTANAGGGVIVGLLRPYEIQVTDSTGSKRYVKYESADSILYLNSLGDPAASGPGFSKGWNGLKVTPGIYLKTGLRFDYGRFNEMINAIEVGVTGEFYTKKIPQMIYQKQKQLFFSAYFSILFGKRK
jgi:hypothetical protein